MRSLLAILLASCAFSAAAALPVTHYVDLDQPGALQQVRQDKPTDYRAIEQILREAPWRTPQSIPGWVRTAFDADMASVLIIKTSYPPQAKLSFVLGDTHYTALVTLKSVQPSVQELVQ